MSNSQSIQEVSIGVLSSDLESSPNINEKQPEQADTRMRYVQEDSHTPDSAVIESQTQVIDTAMQSIRPSSHENIMLTNFRFWTL